MANTLGQVDFTSAPTINGVPITASAELGDVEDISGDATIGVNTGLALVTPSGSDITVTMPSSTTMLRICTIKIPLSYEGGKSVIVSGTIDGISGHTLNGAGDKITLYPTSTGYETR